MFHSLILVLESGGCVDGSLFLKIKKMYHDKFNLAVLGAKEKRLTAEINIIERRLEEKKALRERVKFEKLAQEYRLFKLVTESP